MVPVIIIAVSILVVAGIAYGAWSRRRVYQSVDELDKRKNNVINEPIADEISRVKGLTISGETEENFERWRKAWDSIVEDRFQEIELDLFDIEEAANKYQFKKAKERLKRLA
ncbi:septation ring formation regulator EzrA [Geomicrobium sp. JCM 19037]|uniref:septation ring formation regulator EzrA n=1 Tax=Geomicrobium sp. JCM 19037 TaxID=1460634 RepID=UPI0005AB8741|nr:septation ring formation regulator EzrA [Geomicrobium sp. JCM 19037]